jgi:hypothetical protein
MRPVSTRWLFAWSAASLLLAILASALLTVFVPCKRISNCQNTKVTVQRVTVDLARCTCLRR